MQSWTIRTGDEVNHNSLSTADGSVQREYSTILYILTEVLDVKYVAHVASVQDFTHASQWPLTQGQRSDMYIVWEPRHTCSYCTRGHLQPRLVTIQAVWTFFVQCNILHQLCGILALLVTIIFMIPSLYNALDTQLVHKRVHINNLWVLILCNALCKVGEGKAHKLLQPSCTLNMYWLCPRAT